MIKYTKRYVNIVSLIITTIIIICSTNKIESLFKKTNIHSISNLFVKDLVLVELKSNNINKKTKEENYPISINDIG